ncbi:cell division protein ZapE [Candidatus Liberibacter asiaticus]
MSLDLVSSRLISLIQDKKLKYNPAQESVVKSFDRLLVDLYKQQKQEQGIFSWLWNLRGIKRKYCSMQGIYLHGDVGQGKSMLMNLFFALVPIEKKCRLHFYEFMKDVHSRIIMYRKKIEFGEILESDPIPLVASSIALESRVLCFDEFMITNIADAIILSRLFAALFSHGCIIVMTSNFIPENLYKDEINRNVLVSFIELLEKKLEIISLDSGQDYRRKEQSILPIYMTPLNSYNRVLMDKLWAHITKGKKSLSLNISTEGGYEIHVPFFCSRVSRFSFFDLCDRPLSANDFVEIANRFDVVIINHIPLLKEDRKDWIKRFIMLIDVFYEHKIGLIISSEENIEDLFPYKLRKGAFEIQRTVSRLYEMFSAQYIGKNKIIIDACKILLSNKSVNDFFNNSKFLI